MKKLLSLILVLLMVLSVGAVAFTGASALSSFKEGNILYLDLSKWTSWLDSSPVFYANFTDAIKDAGGQIDIATADKTKYSPKTPVEQYDQNVYKYTVTKADEGKNCMRFWRGNATTLWNYSVLITADDYQNGNNCIEVSGKNGEGTVVKYGSVKLKPSIKLSKSRVEKNERVDISVKCDNPDSETLTLSYEILINAKKVSDTDSYTFVSSEEGEFVVIAKVTAKDENGETVAEASTNAVIYVGITAITALKPNNFYVHASKQDSADSEAWIAWRNINNDSKKYFYLPSSIKEGEEVEIFNSFSADANFTDSNLSATAKAGAVTKIKLNKSTSLKISVSGKTYDCVVKYSSAEAAVFANNVDVSQTGGKELWQYLIENKNNEAACSGAVTFPDGSITVENIKKMKGRGNTSWKNEANPKYGWNLTFNSAIKLGTMQECKKFSLISNFQDPALERNRFLYDLADATDMPYASDSRFIDFYVNGEYKGAYMMAQKVDAGKNTLMDDIDDEEYLAYLAKEKSDFAFCIELSGSGDDKDASVRAKDGNYITMKNPGLSKDDPDAHDVLVYVKSKYDQMSAALTNKATNLSSFIDIDSIANMYLLNEYAKNWDSGASSVFYVYKPDKDGKYKFFASPVWDYDNSIGNPEGTGDYMLPTGWWAKNKDGISNNTYKVASSVPEIMKAVYQIWFEKYVPCIDLFLNKTNVSTGELWSQDVYYNLLSKQADMNYDVSPMTVENGWIGNHSSLQTYNVKYSYDSKGYINKADYSTGSRNTYNQRTFKGQYDYMLDWIKSREAWVSSQYIEEYNKIDHPDPVEPTEPTTEPTVAPEPDPEPVFDLKNVISMWQFDPTGKVSGEKLSEYGSADEGYAATKGTGLLTLSINGKDNKALEWSKVEYGTQGMNMVPVIAAGNKNQWFSDGTPFIQIDNVDTSNYEVIKLTAYLAGSNKAPAKWKVQYSIDGENYKDFSNNLVTITAENRKVLTAYIDKQSLPEDTFLVKNLSFRITANDKVTINGGNVLDSPTSGEIAINYIIVEGTEKGQGKDLRGDADCNGVVTINDATMIQMYLAHLITLSEQGKKNASIDSKGQISISCATIIQQYLAKLIPEI